MYSIKWFFKIDFWLWYFLKFGVYNCLIDVIWIEEYVDWVYCDGLRMFKLRLGVSF